MTKLDYASPPARRPTSNVLAYVANGVSVLAGVTLLIIIFVNDGGWVRIFDGMASIALGCIQSGVTVATLMERPRLRWLALSCLAIPILDAVLCFTLPYQP